MNARQYRSLHYKTYPHISAVIDNLDSSSIGMDFIHQEMQAELAGFMDNKKSPVYNQTTIPILNGKSSSNVFSSNGINGRPQQGDNDSDLNLDTNLSNLPQRDPVDIEFRDLSLTVNLGFRKGDKEILHNVNGKFPGSQLIAIMGPSGAGKSTLLDALSGFKITGVDGLILLNGRKRDLPTFRRMSCYITQDDRLNPLLTVSENMKIAARLKMGPNVPYEEKASRIEDILILLGLYNHSDTLAKRLSGGQKKRLSIALELLNNPTVMFLDEPTTGLDSHSCNKVIELLKMLSTQGRTIICTIHQPTAKLFEEFDQVYVLSAGNCMYQGATHKLVPFLQSVDLQCPMYHNPADYIIELACGEYGFDKCDILKTATSNGSSWVWFKDNIKLYKAENLMKLHPIKRKLKNKSLNDTSYMTQMSCLMERGIIKIKRDTTLTHLRVIVNVLVAVMLSGLYVGAGNEGSRVLDNYNLLFAILIHHSTTTMMLTVLTFPTEMNLLLKEHFNRWYSLKAYFTSLTILDIPISVFSCFIFTAIIYYWTAQPLEWNRFLMFFTISMLIVWVGQGTGLMIGAWFDVVNGTFLAPVSTIPMMMFAGFGVTLRDLPDYLKWGSYVSYLRYGLEGFVSSIYGFGRETLDCEEAFYCHYRYPHKFLSEITMSGNMFWYDVAALSATVVFLRIGAFFTLRAKIRAVK